MTDISAADCLFVSSRVPILQNKVYASAQAARTASSGTLCIARTGSGVITNTDFDEALMVYDQDYDNSVPSALFMGYYDRIADHIVENYDLENGIVIDIGCGKGTFLSRMADRYNSVSGYGIDPSYEGAETLFDGRIEFITEYFSQEHISSDSNPAIVLCRHTLEHVSEPTVFLRRIFDAFLHHGLRDVPIFIEVPDIDWIIKQNAFWDFCYEHVNYFSHSSLVECITRAGAQVTSVGAEFGGQYIWAEAVFNPSAAVTFSHDAKPDDAQLDFAESAALFREQMQETGARIQRLSAHRKLVVWGMATKGVMFSLHMENIGISISHCVDINLQKIGKYSPLTANRIAAPSELKQDEQYAVICMNPNYVDEIRAQCSELGLDATFFLPDGVAAD